MLVDNKQTPPNNGTLLACVLTVNIVVTNRQNWSNYRHRQVRNIALVLPVGQSDGAHNSVTARALEPVDIMSLNTSPMISGYYTALERTFFVETVDANSLAIWQANVDAHEYDMNLLKPGVSCAEVTQKVNVFFAEREL